LNQFERVHHEIYIRRIRLAALASLRGKSETKPVRNELRHMALSDRIRVIELPSAPVISFDGADDAA
jgi:hypothetical protein